MNKDFVNWLVANGKVRDELRNISGQLSKHRKMLDVAAQEQNNTMIGGCVALIQQDVNRFLALFNDEGALSQIAALTLENNKITEDTSKE